MTSLRPYPSPLTLFGVLFTCSLLNQSAPAVGQPPAAETHAARELSILAFEQAQPFERLEPKIPLTDEEQARAKSLALYGKGRLCFQREEYLSALHAYQRAWQWNPDATALLWEIVPLTFHLEHQGEAIRYAIIASEQRPRDPEMMLQLALVLANQGDLSRARALLESALGVHAEQDLMHVELQFEQARLSLLDGAEESAAQAALVVLRALEEPEKFQTSSAELHDALAEVPVAFGFLTEIFFRQKMADEAARAVDGLHRIAERPELRLYHDARVAWLRGDFAMAEAKLDEYLAAGRQPGGDAPYELLEQLLTRRLGQVDGRRQLRKRLDALLLRQPANDALALFAARICLADGEAPQAAVIVEPLIANARDGEPFRLLLRAAIDDHDAEAIPVLLGQTLDRLGSLQPLATEIDRLCQDTALLEQVLQAAQKRLADKIRPMLASESLASGLLCLSADRFDLADRFADYSFAAGGATQDKSTAKLLWAEECYLVEHFPPAIRLLRELVNGATDEAPVAVWSDLLAAALQLAGQVDSALTVIDEAVENDPEAAALRLRRALIFAQAERWDEARAAYQDLVTTFGEKDYADDAKREVVKIAKTYLAALLVEQDKTDEAVELLLQVLDEFPEDSGAGNDLGYLWADQNVHLQLALRMTERAVNAEPENVAYLDSLAWVYYRLGQAQEALPLLTKATSEGSEDAVILDHLGDVYEALGEMEKAISSWKRAVQVAQAVDDQEQARSIRKKLKRPLRPVAGSRDKTEIEATESE